MVFLQMAKMREVEVQALDAARLEPLIGRDRAAQFERVAETTQAMLAGASVLNVNSTATGGGSHHVGARLLRIRLPLGSVRLHS